MSSAGLSQVTTAPAQDDTSGNAHLLPGPAPVERFEVARRGYDRRQVEEFVDRSRRDAAARRATWDRSPWSALHRPVTRERVESPRRAGCSPAGLGYAPLPHLLPWRCHGSQGLN